MYFMNVLEVTGDSRTLDTFRLDMSATLVSKTGQRVTVPLYFGRLLPRPTELDHIEESSVGLRGYQALYGAWEELLNVRWVREANVHDRQSLIRFLEQVDEKHIAVAQRYRLNECKYGFRNWYAWNLEHYGTKWDLDNSTVLEQGEGKLTYRFQTADNPPLPWFELLRESYPSLRMKLTHRNPWKLAAQAEMPLNRFY